MPVLLGHPTKNGGQYKGNEENLMVGHALQEVLITNSGELVTPVSVTDDRGVKLIEDCLKLGKSPEISPAYWVEGYTPRTDGGFNQKRSSYDHLALLEPGEGRGGEAISLRLDSAEGENISTPQSTEIDSAHLTIISQLKGEVAALQGEIAALKNEVNKRYSLDEINQRALFWQDVLKLDSELKIDYSLPTSEVKSLYLKKKFPGINLDGKASEYIDGLFDALTSDQLNSIGKVDRALSNPMTPVLDGIKGSDPIAEARAKRILQIQNGGK
jgi:hypothetical protein